MAQPAHGARGRHPDFVIVHPAKGLLVLEVKDWRMDTIASATKSDVELVTTSGSVRTISPFEQARGYMFDVMKLIQSDGILLHPPGHAYQGKSIVPFGYGVVFTNITRKQFAQTDLHEVFPEDRCVFKDEMSESIDAEVFRTRLWKMVPPRIGSPLTLPQFDRLRALLFPEIRIRQFALPLAANPSAQEDRTLSYADMRPAGTLLIAGSIGCEAPLNWIRRQALKVERIGSICTGALVLAATGSLGGKRATPAHARSTYSEAHPCVTDIARVPEREALDILRHGRYEILLGSLAVSIH
jgi:hypothetical protein